jgi:hypothetical protein
MNHDVFTYAVASSVMLLAGVVVALLLAVRDYRRPNSCTDLREEQSSIDWDQALYEVPCQSEFYVEPTKPTRRQP